MYPDITAPHAVYIHIPFCTNKCFYCDFNSYVLKGQPVMDYLRALELEMARTVADIPPTRIDTIYVGGGTPTVLTPEQMAFFLSIVKRYFPYDPTTVEFTMEANPGTTDAEKLAVMKDGGVNRISFGVQSFDDHLLQRIGRIHSIEDVYRSLELARKAGFANLSIDLMFGLPDQTLATLDNSLTAALELDLQHYSIYGLKVEENTLFHTLFQRNELPLPDEDIEFGMYKLIMDRLQANGYEQYEISNFAQSGFASKHNNTYWRNQGYYGLGAGAHGYTHGKRHINVIGIGEYITAASLTELPRGESYSVSQREAMEDFMMVGLRLLSGVRNSDFRAQFGHRMEESFGASLNRLVSKGLLEAIEDGYRLTANGLLFGNEVFGEFIGVLSTMGET